MNWPAMVALGAICAGGVVGARGVYLLAGEGWAMVAGAVVLFLFGAALLRGLNAK